MAGKLFHHIIKTQSIEAYQLLLYGKVSLISDMPNPNAPTNTGARASGRIPVAFCATNDSVGILGEDVDVGDDYNAIVQETLDKEITEKTRKNYRNRLKKIIDYWREHCNEYYQQGVRQVAVWWVIRYSTSVSQLDPAFTLSSLPRSAARLCWLNVSTCTQAI